MHIQYYYVLCSAMGNMHLPYYYILVSLNTHVQFAVWTNNRSQV